MEITPAQQLTCLLDALETLARARPHAGQLQAIRDTTAQAQALWVKIQTGEARAVNDETPF